MLRERPASPSNEKKGDHAEDEPQDAQPDIEAGDEAGINKENVQSVDRDDRGKRGENGERGRPRSEEHTSELQSLMRISYAVFCLKKKKIRNQPAPQVSRPQTKYDNTRVRIHVA